MRIEVGVLRWRTEGWVALHASGENTTMTVVTKPGSVPVACRSSSSLLAPVCTVTINARTAGATDSIRVSLLDSSQQPVSGYSGGDAATFSGDDVAAALAWSGRGIIPFNLSVMSFEVELPPQSDLFGLTIHSS